MLKSSSPLNGEDSYGAGFCPVSSVGSHNRPTSAEDNEEALLLGCPPIGPFRDEQVYDGSEEKAKRKPYIPGLKRRGFTAKSGNFGRLTISIDDMDGSLRPG
jgi:hypothetical protein